MKKAIDRAKLENVEWFSKFTVLERIRIARKNLQRTRRLKGLALNDLENIEHLRIIKEKF